MTPSFVKAAAVSLFFIAFGLNQAYAAVEQDGRDEAARYEYAESLFRQGAYDAAVAELNGFIKDYPKGEYTDDAYYWLGMYYMKEGRQADGLEQFNIILSLMPDGDKAPAAQFELAYYWYNPAVRERDLERAMAEFLKIPYFYPDSPQADDARYYAALCQYGQGRYDKAAEELTDFIVKFPESEFAAPAGYRLGLSQLLDGKAEEALASFQAVRDAYPAGLYSAQALYAVELVKRAAGEKPPAESYRQGKKGEEAGKFYKPSGAACDREGGIYVADTGNSRVQRFRFSGGGLEVVTPSITPAATEEKLMMDDPSSVAVGPDGKVYVADAGENRVQVFGQDGALLMTFGKKGSGPGELNGPAGIAVDDGGFIYVADRLNKRVSVFDSHGRFDRSVGVGGDQDRSLRSPSAVAVDIKGNLLVADDAADRLYGFDRQGALVLLYEKGPAGAFELKEPSGIAVDGVGNVYVADRGRGVVMVFDRDLKPLMEFPAAPKLEKPSGVAVSDSGDVVVSDYGDNSVVVFK